MLKDGSWTDVQVRPDCLVMNAGDALVKTTGRFKATTRRVVDHGEECYHSLLHQTTTETLADTRERVEWENKRTRAVWAVGGHKSKSQKLFRFPYW